MNILLYGLPGSGRKTLINKLVEYLPETGVFYDFCEKSEEKIKEEIILNKNNIFTMFIPNLQNIIGSPSSDSKLVIILLQKIFEKTKDKRYSEFFGIDINYVYENNPFLNDEIEKRIGYFYIIGYNYNFEHLKEILNNFDNAIPILESDIQNIIKESLMKFGNNQDEVSMFQQNFSVHF
jgi:hypothetical protein